jgi:hypothetical protein
MLEISLRLRKPTLVKLVLAESGQRRKSDGQRILGQKLFRMVSYSPDHLKLSLLPEFF